MRLFLLFAVILPLAADPKADAIHNLIDKYRELGYFNGSALVADGGAIVLSRGYGLANMEWGVANTPDTKFRLGSITKQFTAALILQLAEEGKLELNAPLTRYLPDYPNRTGDKITIAQLLNHTNGIPGYTELPQMREWATEPTTPAAFVKKFAVFDLLFEPGTKYSYSNSGYFVAGYIVEKLTGKPYAQVLQARIFEPAGMRESGYDMPGPILPKRAAGYDSTFNGYRNSGYLDMTVPYAAGSLYSTVEDLYKWDQALHGERILKQASKEKMFTPGLSNYGYGFIITRSEGVTTISHGGGINGFNTSILRQPETKRLVVLLNNTGPAPLPAMTAAILGILAGGQPKMPKPSGSAELRKLYDASGIEAVMNRVREWHGSADPPFNADEGQLSRLASYVVGRKQADGVTLARYIAERHPKSAGAALSLARAEEAAGHGVEALQAYGKAMELSDTPRGFPMITDAIRRLSGAK